MAQARIMLRDQVLEDGQRILKATNLNSLSELFSILITRYGKHLESTWVLSPPHCQCTSSSINIQQELPQNFDRNEADLESGIIQTSNYC
jgi:hypothetical protein